MAESELGPDEIRGIVPEAVLLAYAEEEQFLAACCDRASSDEGFDLVSRTGDRGVTSRIAIVIGKVEERLGARLTEETKQDISENVYAMYHADAPQ